MSGLPVSLLVKGDCITKGCKFGAHRLPNPHGAMDRTQGFCELGYGGNLPIDSHSSVAFLLSMDVGNKV